MSLSVVVLAHNSDGYIGKCLDSLVWCDDVLVIDDESTDNTQSISKKKGARVYVHKLNGDWAAQRNFALTKVKTDWVFFVDSDEIVSEAMRVNIQDHLQADDVNGFFVRRVDKFLGKVLGHGETANVQLLRLAKRKGGKWKRAVHEVWDIPGFVGYIDEPLVHDRNLTISDFIDRLNRYTDVDAQELIKERKNYRHAELLKPVGKFIDSYILKLGFLDGFPGFAFALLMSFYSLVVRIKTWELKNS